MANILGINLSELSFKETVEKISGFLNDKNQHYIVTPNPEIILFSHQDEELFYILNKADLALADGVGLQFAARLNGVKIPRVTGADLTIELLKRAAQQGIRVLVLNWQGGLSKKEEIGQALSNKFPGLSCRVIDIDRDKFLAPEIIEQINAWQPALLFVNLGFPFQEKVLFHNLKKLTSVRVGLGVGGSFDFLTGHADRAPRILRIVGLEWLWRLIKKPSRWKRIYNATIVFLGKVLKARFINPHLYRPNVACLLYKKENGRKKILLVEREDSSGHWQMPQGGTDGEDLVTAGTRELCEETGVHPVNLKVKGTFSNIQVYEFPNRPQLSSQIYGSGVNRSRRFQSGYKGQKQGLCVAEYLGNDQDIHINFWDHQAWKWVDADKLVESVYPSRRESAEIFLNKFKSLNL
jgi:N-acetylglucosaminyldiphosphoundecaprenol N-acetyl-beta-D-mannosaminyltransferase